MVEIIKNANDTITFTCDDYILPCTLVKVEKVTDNSNYYCLWLNKNEFYLYNVQNKKFALNINTYREAKLFYKIENYSNYSRTFVAYRSDKEYAYILFEDGNYENYVFKNVGKENKGIRPVKGCNNKWDYYDVFKKVFLYNISKGLNLSEDEELGLFFNHNCYTIYKKDLYYKFIFFDKDKHKIYYSDKLEYIGETYDDKIISKIFNKNIYALLDYKNPTRAFGYYTSKPRYIDSKNIFIAKKINSYVIINNCREVSNCQWTDDNFIFHHDYILNKTETGILKLYNYSDGKEICTNWKNIRFDKDSQCIIADTDNKKNKKISKSDINKLSMLLYKESRKCFECLETSIRPIKEEKSKYIVNKLDDAKLI